MPFSSSKAVFSPLFQRRSPMAQKTPFESTKIARGSPKASGQDLLAAHSARAQSAAVARLAFEGKFGEALGQTGLTADRMGTHLGGTALGWALAAGEKGFELACALARRGARASGIRGQLRRGRMGAVSGHPLSLAIESGYLPGVELALAHGGLDNERESRSCLRGEAWSTAIEEARGRKGLTRGVIAALWREQPLRWSDSWVEHADLASPGEKTDNPAALARLISEMLAKSDDAQGVLDFFTNLRLPAFATRDEEVFAANSFVRFARSAPALLAMKERWGARHWLPEHPSTLRHSPISAAWVMRESSDKAALWRCCELVATELTPEKAGECLSMLDQSQADSERFAKIEASRGQPRKELAADELAALGSMALSLDRKSEGSGVAHQWQSARLAHAVGIVRAQEEQADLALVTAQAASEREDGDQRGKGAQRRL